MTIGTVAPLVEYIENGATTAHAIPFQFEFASEIRCTRIFGGVETVLVQGSDFSVAGGGGGTGTVNKVNGGTNTAVFRIERVTSRAQGLDLVPGGDFPADANEKAFDRLSRVDQEQDVRLGSHAEQLLRAFLAPIGETGAIVPALAGRKGKYWKWDADTGLPIAANPAEEFVTPNFEFLPVINGAAGSNGSLAVGGAWPDITLQFTVPRGSSGGLTDGDFGDIVSAAGVVTIKDGVVGPAKFGSWAGKRVMANIGSVSATPSLVTLDAFTGALSDPTSAAKGVVPILPGANGSFFWHRGDNQWAKQPYDIPIACSDEVSALTVGTAKVTFTMPRAFTLTSLIGSLKVAQATNGAGGIFTVDIKKNGTTIFGANKLTIDNAEKSSLTAVTAASISTTAFAAGDEITVDITQVGDGTAKGLKLWLLGTIG